MDTLEDKLKAVFDNALRRRNSATDAEEGGREMMWTTQGIIIGVHDTLKVIEEYHPDLIDTDKILLYEKSKSEDGVDVTSQTQVSL